MASGRVRGIGLGTAALLVATAFSVVGGQAVGAVSSTDCASATTGKATEAAASATAGACGKRVEAIGDRTEYGQVFANPSGDFTLEQHVAPIFAHGADGSWRAVDTKLHFAADGMVVPAATVLPVAFSGGGNGALATLTDGADRLSVSWQSTLPKPVLDSDSALYPEVLPGVDLRVTASALGFSEVLVVKTPAAAANPALSTVDFGLSTTGVTVAPAPDGGLEAKDARGDVVFTAPTALMWDSSGRSPTPGRQAAMPVRLGAGRLSVVPDHAMLADHGASFPLYIDPSWTGGKKNNAFTTVWSRSDLVNSSFWQRTDAMSNGATLGDVGSGRTCDSSDSSGNCLSTPYLVRTFFMMDLSGVIGKHIIQSDFNIDQKWAWTCNPKSNAKLWFMTDGIKPTTTWNNQPAADGGYTVQAPANHRSGAAFGCSDSGLVTFNATLATTHALSLGYSDVTLGLIALDESTTSQWKRFDDSTASLAIDYNTVPGTPDQLDTYGQGCATDSSQRPVIASGTPTFSARMNDADPETDLIGNFSWQVWNGEEWLDVGSATTAALSSGTTAQVTVSPALNNGVYHWRVYTADPWSMDGQSGTDTSAWSAWCEFQVDTIRPNTAVVTADSGDAPYAMGKTVRLTFSQGGSPPDTDVTGYIWWVQDGLGSHPSKWAPGGVATVDWTPPASGQATVYVEAKDRVQTSLNAAAFAFNAAQPTTEVARWPLSEPAGATTLADTTGDGHGATAALPSPSTLGAPGRIVNGDTVASLAGGTSAITAAGPVIDTGRDFTVSAWVRLDSATKNSTAIGVDGTRNSAFYLQYRPDTNQWSMTATPSDSDSWTATKALSSTTPTFGVWTNLTGLYDSASGTVKLYVNGRLDGQATGAHLWSAAGPLTIGRGQFTGSPTDYWHGAVSDVRVWGRALTDGEVAAIADPSAQANTSQDTVGDWLFNEGNGTYAYDSSAYYHDLTLNLDAGAGWTAAGHTGTALSLKGAGAAQTAGPVVNTDQSFTVSAWAELTGSTLPTTNMTVLSQDGTQMSGFYLRYQIRSGTPSWCFSMLDSDDAAATWRPACTTSPVTTASLNTWVHLLGVFDAQSGRLALYVGGNRADDGTAVVAGRWRASGPLAVGRDLWTPPGGTTRPADYFAGGIDDVTIQAGMMPADEITSLTGRWHFNDGIGGTAADSSWFQRPLTLTGTAAWTTSGHTGGALALDGGGQADAAGPILDTGTSFTASAWVNLSGTALPSRNMTVLSEDGTQMSGFYLGERMHNGSPVWAFSMVDGDDASGVWHTAWSPAALTTAVLGTWVHLVGVFDASTGQLALYVDGTRVDDGSGIVQSRWTAGGALVVGRDVWTPVGGATQYPDHVVGAVDDVTVYAGAVPSGDVPSLS